MRFSAPPKAAAAEKKAGRGGAKEQAESRLDPKRYGVGLSFNHITLLQEQVSQIMIKRLKGMVHKHTPHLRTVHWYREKASRLKTCSSRSLCNKPGFETKVTIQDPRLQPAEDYAAKCAYSRCAAAAR